MSMKERPGPSPKKAKAQVGKGGKGASKGPVSVGGSGGGGGPSGGDKSVVQLLAEVERAFQEAKEKKSLDDISQEALASLVSRLQAKKNQLAKKMSKRAGDNDI